MDRTDRTILELLQQDARLSVAELAERVSLTSSPCWRRVKALEQQKKEEELRLTSTKGQALNRVVEEYQRLQLEAEFAQDVYRTAIVALEKGRVEATRTLKKLTIVQSPTLPEYPLEPRRIYNIVVFALGALLLAGIAHLLGAIIRDHKD